MRNGSFEAGESHWASYSTGDYRLITDEPDVPAHSGNWKAWLGGVDDETSLIEQAVTVPSNGMLTYWMRIYSSDPACSSEADIAAVILDDGSDDPPVVDVMYLCEDTATTGYIQRTINLAPYAGWRVNLSFHAATDLARNSHWIVDDVALQGQSIQQLGTAGVDMELATAVRQRLEQDAHRAVIASPKQRTWRR